MNFLDHIEHLDKRQLEETLKSLKSEEDQNDFDDFLINLEGCLFDKSRFYPFPICIERPWLEEVADEYIANYHRFKSDYITWYILVGFLGHESCAYSLRLKQSKGFLLSFFGSKEVRKKKILDHLYNYVMSKTIMINALYDLCMSAHKEDCYINSSLFKVLDKLKLEQCSTITIKSLNTSKFDKPDNYYKAG